MKRILALDLGNETGWATGYLGGVDLQDCGTVRLATKSEVTAQGQSRMNRRLDCRIPRLYDFLAATYLREPFDWLVFEDVEFSTSTAQTQLWSSLRTVVWLFAHQRFVQTECCPVKTLKKAGASFGGATKSMMGFALVKKDVRFCVDKSGKIFFGDKQLTDDAVDAVHLLKWAQQILRNTK